MSLSIRGSHVANIFSMPMTTDTRTKVTALDNDQLRTGKLRNHILNGIKCSSVNPDEIIHY